MANLFWSRLFWGVGYHYSYLSMENNDREKYYDDGGQNLTGYVNVLRLDHDISHLEYQLPLWDMKL